MRYFFAYIVICLSISCSSNTDELKEEMIQSELNRKMEQYRNELIDACKQQASEEAEAIVDSILLNEENNKIDPTHLPRINPKPKFVPVDTSVFNSQSSVKPPQRNSTNR